MVQIDRLVAAISDTDEPVPAIMASLKAKEIERVGLEERIRLLGAETNVTTLHPNTLTAFGKSVEKLHASLTKGSDAPPEACAAFRNVVDSIVVHPTEYRKPYEVSVYGRLSAIMGVDLFPTIRSNQEILAGEGVSRALVASTSQGQVQHGNTCRELRLDRTCVLFMTADAL
jgi:site-specific DNA recombinase